MTEQLFNEIAAWQQDTFPGGTPDSTLHHLLDEIRELRYALRLDPSSSHEELADCMFLLFGCADRMGMSYQDIQEAIQTKFSINKARKLGKPNEKGVVNHVDEPSVIIATPGEGAVIVEKPPCDGNCGMNYCDENGCTERKRNLVEPCPPGVSEENATGLTLPESKLHLPSRGIDGHEKLMDDLRKSEIN